MGITQRNKNQDVIAIWDSINDAVYCGFNEIDIENSIKNKSKCCKDFYWTKGIDEHEILCQHIIDMRWLSKSL